jgi:hypothetical protein
MTRTSTWSRPDKTCAHDSPRMKDALAAAERVFRNGSGWRSAVRAAIAVWQGSTLPAIEAVGPAPFASDAYRCPSCGAVSLDVCAGHKPYREGCEWAPP